MKVILQSVLALLATCVAASAAEKGAPRQFSARLSGYNEVHFNAGPPATLRGAISTKATGSFTATLNNAEDIIDYELSYSGLEGNVTQAHPLWPAQHGWRHRGLALPSC